MKSIIMTSTPPFNEDFLREDFVNLCKSIESYQITGMIPKNNLGMFKFPESPRWLIQNNRFKEAEIAMIIINKQNGIDTESEFSLMPINKKDNKVQKSSTGYLHMKKVIPSENKIGKNKSESNFTKNRLE